MMGHTVALTQCTVKKKKGFSLQPADTLLELTDESAHFCEGTPAPPGLLSRWRRCWPHPTLRSCARHER